MIYHYGKVKIDFSISEVARIYRRRSVGDVIQNNAVLLERINGRLWKIQCACGNEFVAQPSSCSGRCRKCGYDYLSSVQTIHGESPSEDKKASRLYRIWLGIKQRCTNTNTSDYAYYGKRGISVCNEWLDYTAFKTWALSNGYSDNLTIDRIDVNGNYEPDNCRWITQKEQCRNKRTNSFITYNGQTKTLAEWAEITGIKYHTLKNRINKYGFSIEDAFTIPAYCGNNQHLRKHTEKR